MSDANEHVGTEPTVDKSKGHLAAAAYVLYLVGLILWPTPFIALIMAYVLRGKNPSWVEGHYRFIIRGFWISLLYSIPVLILGAAFVGDSEPGLGTSLGIGALFFLSFPAYLLWSIIRDVRGLMFVLRGEAIPDPASWGVGGSVS